MNNRERIKAGFRCMAENKALFLIPVLYVLLIGLFTLWAVGKISFLPVPFNTILFRYIFFILMTESALLGALGLCTLVGLPPDAKKTQQALSEIQFTDKAGAVPLLLTKKKDKNGMILEFFSSCIPLSEYKKRSNEIETALNIRIVSVDSGRDMRHVKIKAVLGNKAKERKQMIKWNNKLLSNKDFELVLGESDFGTESVDIAITPHILLGGGTGSGKTKLMKLILIECVAKGAKVFIADFKGGVDYPQVWREKCSLITDAQQFIKQLDEILSIMQERRELLRNSQTSNISDYRKKTGEELPRIIVAVDEIAEVLDKTGLEKDEKAVVNQIEAMISTIARLGRAFGIHLVLATQRPDAEVLKGQIKNNLPYKVCGRADKVLSQIILDVPDAADVITPEDQGMFYTNSHVLFKAYYVEDDALQDVAK